MGERFVILRTEDVDIHDPFSGTLAEAATRRSPGFRLESQELERGDVLQMNANRNVIGAPAMELRLIAPLAAADAAETTNVTWGVRAVGADTSPFTGDGVTVAILDTGIDASHPAFTGVELVQRDFTGEGNGDQNGHGTHCAGTVFGRDVDGKRIGVARGVKRALIGKVLGAQGGGSTDMLVDAINWALAEGANVVSMSLSVDFPGYVARVTAQGLPADLATSRALSAYRETVRLLDRLAGLIDARPVPKGTLVVAASGNESKRQVDADYELTAGPPAAADRVLAVGAIGEDEASPGSYDVAEFSNIGVQVCAPGVRVLSAKAGGGLVAFNGTSMATPHVAGVAALWAEHQLRDTQAIDPRVLSSALVAHATKVDIAGSADALDIGTGVVQAPQD